MRNFRKLDCWNLGMEIVGIVFVLMEKLPNAENYGLRSQMSRAVISMPSNIAEGCSRSSNKDTARYFEISIGSAFELETQILAGQIAGYFDQKDIDKVIPKVQEFQRKTNSYRLKILQ
ncbi:MAG: four helix bundle protein [Saprospiraceae bacterium]|jgi:four helix bundle protein